MEHEFIDNCLVILPKHTMDIFLKEDNPAELIALYSFYYYTAKWQGTNQPKCTVSYAAKGLHWGERKVNKINKRLKEIGLIESIKLKSQEGKISGHYIRVKFIFSSSTEEKIHTVQNEQYEDKNHTDNFAQCGLTHSMHSSTTNALSSNNINALSSNNINALSSNIFTSHSENDKNTKKSKVKHKHGQYQNVLLSDDELDKLKNEFPNDYQERIERLSEYIEATGKKYKNFLATIRMWAKREQSKISQQNSRGVNNGINQQRDKEEILPGVTYL